MPSLPDSDLASHTTTGGPTGPSSSEVVLARVKADGLRRRQRRHRRNGVVAAFGLVLLAVPAIALLPDGDGDEDLDVATEVSQPSTTQRPTTTTDAPTTTGVPVTTVTTVPAAPVTVVVPDPGPAQVEAPAPTSPRRTPRTTVPARTPPPAPAPTAELAPPQSFCRNSTDPTCGDFHWEPDPGPNSPLSASLSTSDASPMVGDSVHFTVNWSDGDATLTFDRVAVDSEAGLSQPCSTERRYGPWTPPARNGGSGTIGFDRTFGSAGDHVVTVSLATADCNSPYGSERTVQIVVSVQEPPAPAPTTEPVS